MSEITQSNISTINIDTVDRDFRSFDGEVLHAEIMRVRPDLNCLVHLHPLHSCALAATGRKLRTFSKDSALFFENVCYLDVLVVALPAQESHRDIARALGLNNIALSRKHGLIVCGASIEEVVVSVVRFENAARVQLLLDSCGGVTADIPDAEIRKFREQTSSIEHFENDFDYLTRRLRRAVSSFQIDD